MQNSGKEKSLPLFAYLLLFTIMTSPRFDLLAAVRASAVDYELNAGVVFAVSAWFMASLAIPHRIGVNVVFRAFARRGARAPMP